MKRTYLAALLAAVATAAIAGSADWSRQSASTQSITQPGAAQSFQIAAASQEVGKVIETMNTGGYTYVSVDTGARVFWAAAPQFAVKVGETVSVPAGSLMRDHHSKTLDRTFDEIYFVNAIGVEGGKSVGVPAEYGGAAATESHSRARVGEQSTSVDLSGIAKADGGKTIGEIFDERSALSGQEVHVRAKVVKFTPQIMGTNWIHLQDGTSGSGGENDLTITTANTADVGSTVLVRGKVILDRDFGFGYRYDVMIESAEVTAE